MRKLLRWLLLGLVLVMVALVSALTAMRLAIHGREVAVPKLVGMLPADAEQLAAANGLVLSVENHFYSADVPKGRIVSQLPSEGTRVRRGWLVRAAESLGPQRATVPRITGESLHAAQINLERHGLDLGGVAVAHLAGYPPEQVIAQDPPAFATGVASPKVSLLMTAPDESEAFVMPDFTGKRFSDVASLLKESELEIGNVTQSNEAGFAPGTVVRQSPAAGRKIVAGTSVDFVVAR